MAMCNDCIHRAVCVILAFPDAFENTKWDKEPCDHFKAADVAPRAEVAREIFEEIEKIIKSPRTVGFCMTAPSFRQAISDYNEGIRKEILYYIAELKKKYTEN